MSTVSLPGRYGDAAGEERACMIRCTSLDDLEISGGAAPDPGDRILCRVPGLGVLAGRAGAAAGGTFRLKLEAGEAQRHRLASRLGWHRNRAAGGPERREAARVVPRHDVVAVVWGGIEGTGRLRDLSAQGAAVDLAPRPPVGAPITIGRRRAFVVRHTEAGVGVRFVLPLAPENVTEDAVL